MLNEYRLKMIIKVGAGLLCALFFLPWITIEYDGTFSGLTLLLSGTFYSLFIPIIYAILLVLTIKDNYFTTLRAISLVGIVILISFSFAMNIASAAAGYAEFRYSIFMYAQFALGVICFLAAIYGIRQEKNEIRKMTGK